MPLPQNKLTKKAGGVKKRVISEMLRLATSGFGLVAALAWNELIKEIIKEYIKPVLGETSGIVSMVIYAVLVTTLAVFVTYNLSRLAGKED